MGLPVAVFWDFTVIEPKGPKCKHGEHVCRRCGIDNYRTASVAHATVGGVGVVGRLRGKK